MNKHLILVPRWAGQPTSDFYPWLHQELTQHPVQPFKSVVVADMPNPNMPIIPEWVTKLGELAGISSEQLAQTVLVGHSVGCQAVLRYLATFSQEVKVAGVLAVAGWWTVDRPWESVLPWIETPLDLARVRAAAQKFVVLISDNDPFTADWVTNERLWQTRLGAQVRVVAGAGHFNSKEEPVVLESLLQNFS